jgi:hypothetical protein
MYCLLGPKTSKFFLILCIDVVSITEQQIRNEGTKEHLEKAVTTGLQADI